MLINKYYDNSYWFIYAIIIKKNDRFCFWYKIVKQMLIGRLFIAVRST